LVEQTQLARIQAIEAANAVDRLAGGGFSNCKLVLPAPSVGDVYIATRVQFARGGRGSFEYLGRCGCLSECHQGNLVSSS